MPLDPQTAAFLDAFNQTDPDARYQLTPPESRALLKEALARVAPPRLELPRVEDQAIPGPRGPIPIRIYWPDAEPGRSRAVLVYFHGGGWVHGDLDTHDPICRYLAAGADLIVVAVDYRLAPEHKFPAGLEDAMAATHWVADHAGELGADPARLAVGGDSAGGNFTAVITQEARTSNPKIAAQVLLYPAVAWARVDDYPSWTEFASGYFFGRTGLDWMQGHYLSDERELWDARVSPILTDDLTGLPPALIVTAGHDPLRDEGHAYAERLADAGVPVDYKCYESTIHAFLSLAGVLDVGMEGLAFIGQWLRHRLWR